MNDRDLADDYEPPDPMLEAKDEKIHREQDVTPLSSDENKIVVNAVQTANEILLKAEDVAVIVSSKDESKAVAFLVEVKKHHEKIDKARDFLVRPLNAHVRNINREFKKTLAPLEEADRIVRKGMSDYRQSEEFKMLEAKRVEIEEQAKVAVRMSDMKTLSTLAPRHEAAAAAAPRVAHTLTGSASFREALRFEITDATLVPERYLSPDEKKIRAAVDFGIREIPGVRIWKESIPIIRS